MNAEPFLAEIVRHLRDLRFDVVLIGNAAAALQGAPVTTVDFDFMFRKTAVNFMAAIHGVRSFAGPRSRAQTIEIGGGALLVASLSDINKIEKAARPRRAQRRNARRRGLAAVRRESDRALVELIRRRLALPVEKRMDFLRKRVGFRGSAL